MRHRLLVAGILPILVTLLAGSAGWLHRGGARDERSSVVAQMRDGAHVATGLELLGVARPPDTEGQAGGAERGPIEAASVPGARAAHAPPPPDPLEQGPCSLTLVCRDEGGAPVPKRKVQLWRLGAPASEHWLAGDQLQATAYTRGGEASWHALPAGRYRVFAPGLRAQAEDPPAFEVAGAQTTVALVLPLPRCVVLRVRALDEYGADLEEARSSLIHDHADATAPPPSWRTERLPRAGAPSPGLPSRRRAAGGPAGERRRAGRAGFEIGTCCESTRHDATECWFAGLELAGRTRIRLKIDAVDVKPPAPLDYVGLSVQLELITSRVWLPGGRLARDAGARFDAECLAVPAPGPTGALDPLALPIGVTVSLDGYVPLQFTFLLAERWRDHTLDMAPPTQEPPPR